MEKFITISIPFIFYLISFSAKAQEREVNILESGWLYWTGYYLEWKLSDELQLDAEIDNRRFFEVNRQYQTVVRTTLFFIINDYINVGAGIGNSSLFSLYTPTIQPEIRPHQEVNLKHHLARWDFNHRIRLEERFRGDTLRTYINPEEVTERTLSSYSFDLRTRYEFATDFNLVDKDQEKGHWNIQFATEIMVNKNIKELLDTYRAYLGFQYFLTEKIMLELGFLKSLEKEYDFDVLFNYNSLRFTFRQRLR